MNRLALHDTSMPFRVIAVHAVVLHPSKSAAIALLLTAACFSPIL